MTSMQVYDSEVKNTLLRVINELAADRLTDVLEFALFVKARPARQRSIYSAQPVKRLEEVWGDFWPEDEPIDDFIEAVRRWRREDAMLHRNLR